MGRRSSLVPVPVHGPGERRLAALLLATTVVSVFAVDLWTWQPDPASVGAWTRAALFSVTLLGILAAHEAGHYAAARLSGFRLGLPLFLPVPFLVGTLGAIIRLREPPRSRTALVEMGAAGPLAGFVAIVLVTVVWTLSGPLEVGPNDHALARPLVFWLVSLVVTGSEPAAIATHDPLGFAAWLGCLVTAMNLVPFGQLDGGHVLTGVAPRAIRPVGWVCTALLLAAGLWWPGWAVWAVVLHVLGARRPLQVRDPRSVGLRGGVVAGLTLVVAVSCLTPVPFRL